MPGRFIGLAGPGMRYISPDRRRFMIGGYLLAGCAAGVALQVSRQMQDGGMLPGVYDRLRVSVVACGLGLALIGGAWLYPSYRMVAGAAPLALIAMAFTMGILSRRLVLLVAFPVAIWGATWVWLTAAMGWVGGATIVALTRNSRRVSWPPLGRCPKCDYDLTGLSDDACPECGFGVSLWRKDCDSPEAMPKRGRLPGGGRFEFDPPRTRR